MSSFGWKGQFGKFGTGGGGKKPASISDIIWRGRNGVESGTDNVVNDIVGTLSDANYVENNVLSFDGNDYVTQTNNLDFLNIGFKFVGSFVLDDTSGSKFLISQQDGTGTGSTILYISNANMASSYGGTNISFNTSLVAGTEYSFILEYDGTTNISLTLNGARTDKTFSPVDSADGDIIWGASKLGTFGFIGKMWNCGQHLPGSNRLPVIITFGDSTNLGISAPPPSPLDQVQQHPFESYIDGNRVGDPWVTTNAYLQSDKAQSGLGDTWGAELELGNQIGSDPTDITGFVKVAVSGSRLGLTWKRGDTHYNQLVTRIDSAFQYFNSLGYHPYIAFATVNLGTNDSYYLEESLSFKANFMNMWRGLCEDSYLRIDTPVVLMRVNELAEGSTTYKAECIASQDSLAASMPNMTLLPTEGYALRDDVHYTSDAIIEQGQDQFTVYDSLSSQDEVISLFSFSSDDPSVAYNVSSNSMPGVISGATRTTFDSNPHNIKHGLTRKLYSDGVAQYINTGVVPTENTKVEITAELYDDAVLLGARNTGATSRFLIQSVGGYYRAQYGNNSAIVSNASRRGVTTITLDSSNFIVGEISTDVTYSSFPTLVEPIYLYCFNAVSVPSVFSEADIYRVRIWESGVLVRDMIPSPSVSGAFLDRVNNVLYSNSGTGTIATKLIPANTSSSYDALGNPITNRGGFTHNGAESLIRQSDAVFTAGTINFWSANGISVDDKSYDDLLAHLSGDNNLWNKWNSINGVCHLNDCFQYDLAKVLTAGERNKNSAYLGTGGGCGGIAPFLMISEGGDQLITETGDTIILE